MSKFNQKTVAAVATATNYAGGQAYQYSPEMELVSILLTSFVNDDYYRSANDTLARVQSLLANVDPLFAAKAAVYGRTKYGMRSISHAMASDIAKHLSGQPWAKDFYNAIIYRPDDMLEIISYHKAKNGKIPASMKKGFAAAFEKFDGYQLGKYRGEGKDVKLIDVVNLVHPIPVEKNAAALKELIVGKLKSTETWEAKLSSAGSNAEAKNQAWGDLIKGKKLGYLALLRNLKNICEQAPDVLNEALESLTNEGFIKASLIFPFQYLVAYKQFAGVNSKEARLIADALSRAIDISCQNVKALNFDGNTLVAVDNSGSMDSTVSSSQHMKKAELGALFGVVLAKAINADIMEFGDRARYISYGLSEHSMKFAADFTHQNRVGHGTNFHSIFEMATKKYNRILIFSDMQGWVGHYAPKVAFQAYRKKFDANPFIYSFDLAGLGTLQFPEDKVFALAGFSDKILKTMGMLETDRNALFNEINAVELK